MINIILVQNLSLQTNLASKSDIANFLSKTKNFEACVCYFLIIFFSPKNSSSKTMKDVFYFI